MALSSHAVRALGVGLCDPDSAREIAAKLNASVGSPAAVVAAIGASTVAAIGATTNLTAVPDTFADVAAVQTYLAGANVVPRVESRLDAAEAKVDVLVASVNALNLKVDAILSSLKASGQMASS